VSGAGTGPHRGWPTGPRLREFEDFDRKYRPIALEYLRSFGGTVSYFDDAVQDAFATVAWRWEEVRRYTSPRGFLFRVARQRWLKHNRYRNNRCAPSRRYRQCTGETAGATQR
jgi:DNA-directed RNA polymerase specialized sigma24 family protein